MTMQTMQKRKTTKLNKVQLNAPPTGPGILRHGDQVKVSLGRRAPIHAYGVVKYVWSDSTNLVVKPTGRFPASFRGTWYVELVGNAASRRFHTFNLERFGEEVCSIKADDAPGRFHDLVVKVVDGRKGRVATSMTKLTASKPKTRRRTT